MKQMNIKITAHSIAQKLKSVIMEIDALKEFLDSSITSIQDNERDFKLKYKYGLILADAFDSVFKEIGFEEQKKRVEEIKSIPINNQMLIKDVVDIIISENDYSDGFLSKISFNILDHNAYKYYNPEGVRRKEAMIDSQKRLLSQSILSSIITIFESYLSYVYELLVTTTPKDYLKEKTIHISQIFDAEISDIIHNTIQHEVEQKMYDSLATLDLIKEKSKFDIDRYYKIRKQFEEIYYRRNIYVHNKGFVNDIYLSKVDKELSKNLKIQMYAKCSKEYLYKAIRILKIIVSTMYYELINTKICDDTSLYITLSEVGFESLCEKEYYIAEHIYNMLRNNKDFEFIDKAIYQINYLIALKQQGKKYLEELQKFDVSIATEKFKIAKFCLEEKFEEAYNLLVQSYPKSFNAISLREWPLFIDFRKTEFYQKFKEDHITDFNEFVFEDSQLSEKSVSDESCETVDKDNNESLPIF